MLKIQIKLLLSLNFKRKIRNSKGRKIFQIIINHKYYCAWKHEFI